MFSRSALQSSAPVSGPITYRSRTPGPTEESEPSSKPPSSPRNGSGRSALKYRQPCFENLKQVRVFSNLAICSMIRNFGSRGHSCHTLPNLIPLAFCSMIYSAPTGLAGSADHARTLGTGRLAISRSYEKAQSDSQDQQNLI